MGTIFRQRIPFLDNETVSGKPVYLEGPVLSIDSLFLVRASQHSSESVFPWQAAGFVKMNTNTYIFIQAHVTIEHIADELDSLLATRFALETTPREEKRYFAPLGSGAILLYPANGFENDRNLNFEDFQYALSLYVPSGSSDAETNIKLGGFSYHVFYKLAQLQKYALMMTLNMQHLLERYDPKSRQLVVLV